VQHFHEAVERALHKGLTRDACTACGIPVAHGFWGTEPTELAHKLMCELDHRVVVKDVQQWAGRGITFHQSVADAAREIRCRRGPLVVEEFRSGEEISLEVVASENEVRVLGWALKGSSELLTHPLARLRFAPATPPPQYLTEAAIRIVTHSGLRGIAEVEFIAHDRSEWCVTEVNPRLSGVTPLIHAARGMTSASMAIRLEAGAPVEVCAVRHACQLRVARTPRRSQDVISHLRSRVHFHPGINGRSPSWFLAATELEDLVSDLAVLDPEDHKSLPTQLLDRVAAAAHLDRSELRASRACGTR
jgi:biotin carboxylase